MTEQQVAAVQNHVELFMYEFTEVGRLQSARQVGGARANENADHRLMLRNLNLIVKSYCRVVVVDLNVV